MADRERKSLRERARDQDEHLYETDRGLFKDVIPNYSLTNSTTNLLYLTDLVLFSQGRDLWETDKQLYRTKEDCDEISLMNEIERLKKSAFLYDGNNMMSSKNNRKNGDLENDEEKDNEDAQCAICLSNFSGKCIRLRCNHQYHETCILQSLEREKRECPMCRGAI